LIIFLPFSVTSYALLAALTGLKLIKQHVVLVNVVSPLFYLFALSIAFLLGHRIMGLTLMLALTSTLTFFLAVVVLRKKFFRNYFNVRPVYEKKKFWSFSWPLFFNQLFQKSVHFTPIFIMGLYLSNADIGIYNISLRVAMMVSILLNALRLIFSPTISSLFAQQNKTLISRLYITTTKWAFTFSLAIFAGIALFGGSLLGIFGSEFEEGIMVLIILSLGEMVNASCGLVGNLIVMSGRPKVASINSFVTLVIIFLLCFFLVPPYGIIGAAISYAVSIAAINLVRVVEIYMFEKLQPFNLTYLKPLVSAIIAFAIIEWMKGLININMYVEMIAGSFLFLLVFGTFIWVFRLDDEDGYILEVIFKRFKK
jgi:O-antigen/teichoic acid export membrane protein